MPWCNCSLHSCMIFNFWHDSFRFCSSIYRKQNLSALISSLGYMVSICWPTRYINDNGWLKDTEFVLFVFNTRCFFEVLRPFFYSHDSQKLKSRQSLHYIQYTGEHRGTWPRGLFARCYRTCCTFICTSYSPHRCNASRVELATAITLVI